MDSIGFWAGLTVFFAGMVTAIPMPSLALSLKVVAVPFCVLLTQVVGRIAEGVVFPRLRRHSERGAELARGGLLLLPFAFLFAIFAVQDHMTTREAALSFANRFLMCLMVVPVSLITVQGLVRLCDRQRHFGSRRGR